MKIFKYHILYIIVLFFLLYVNAFGEDFYNKGIQFFRLGDLDQALSQLYKAHEQDPSDANVIKMIAQIEAEKNEWSEVKTWMNQALKINPGDFVAYYYLAIGYRETGKYRALAFRQQDWEKSENYFQSVLDLAPSYKDVYYQLSILYYYQKKYDLALNTVQKQLELSDKKVQFNIALYEYFESFLYSDNQQNIADWLKFNNGAHKDLFNAELYRYNKAYEKADSLLLGLLEKPHLLFSKIPVYFALARSSFDQNEFADCENYYIQAIDSIQTVFDAELYFNDVRFILSDKEYSDYLNSKTVEGKKEFFNRMWTKRNPLPAYNRNFRIQEHVKRKLYADKYYRFEGFRTTLNNPDKLRYLDFPAVFALNNKYNDKGLVFIRHGSPDDRAIEMQGLDGPMPMHDDVEALLQNESWLYQPNSYQDKLLFHFVIDVNAAGNNWRLTPTIPRELVASRLHWDPIFAKMIMAESNAEWMRLENQMAQQSREFVYKGLDSDRHTWEKDIGSVTMPFYASTFRDSVGKTRLEIYFSLDSHDLWGPDEEYDPDQLVYIDCGLYRYNWEKVVSAEKKVTARRIKAISDSAEVWQEQFDFSIEPGNYRASLSVVVPEENKIAAYKFNSGISAYNGKQLNMSSLVLASSITEQSTDTKHLKNGLEITPNPGLKFSKDDLVSIYFEIYNLPIEEQRSVEYQIEYNVKLLERKKKNFFTHITEMFSKSMPKTTNTVERYATNEFSAEYIGLDLSNNEPGLYELEVETRVPSSLDNYSRKIYFELK